MGSRRVASLFIDVSASTAKLTGSIQKAKAKIDRFKRDTSKSFAGLKSAIFSAKGALLGLAGVGGFGLLVTSAQKSYDEIGKMSDRLNFTVENLQALHHQAGLFGVSSGMVNSSLERMVKRLGEAAQGTGAAKKALEELHLEAKDMIQLSADEQYAKVAEAIGGLTTQAEKSAAVAAIFGREGIKMLGMFNDGKKGVEDARKEIDEFGISLNRVQIKKIENANDSFHRVQQVIKGAAGVIAEKLAPYLEYAAEWFLEVTKQSGGFGKITNNAMEAARTGIGYVLTALDYMKVGWQTIKLGVLAFATVSLKALDAIVEPIRYVNELLGVDQPEALKFLTVLVGDFEQASIDGQVKLMSMIGAVGQNADLVKGKLIDIAEVADRVANIQVNEMMADSVDTPEKAAARTAALKAAEQQAIDEALALKWAAEETHRQDTIAAEKEQYATRLGYISEMMDNLSKMMSAKSKKLFQIGKAASLAAALINTYEAITKTMASVPYPFNIPLAAAQGIAGMVQVQNIKSQQYGGAREFGGKVLAGKRYRVGESGPEDFVPTQDGEIVPNGKGGNKTVNVNIKALDTASIATLFKENRQLLLNTVVEAMHEEGYAF